MLQSSENQPWQPATESSAQPHDEPAPEVQYATYSMPRQFCCVETICAPCGVVIAWATLHFQNHPHTLWSFKRESIQQRNHVQIIFALTKLV